MFQYLVALGSNQRHVRHGRPKQIISAAIANLVFADIKIITASRIISSRPLGPSSRRYANAVLIIETNIKPMALLEHLKIIEAAFGKRMGQPWSRRVLDLDIILWSGGAYTDPNGILTIPHLHMRERAFVLGPAARIAPGWRDPISGLTLAQLNYRQQYPKISMNPA